MAADLPGPNFIKLLSRKCCLTNFLAKQTFSGTQHCKLNVILAGNPFLFSNMFLCLTVFVLTEYKMYMKLGLAKAIVLGNVIMFRVHL